MHLKRIESEDYRSLLEQKRAELERALGKLDDIAVEAAADAMDSLQLAGDRELAIANLERETSLLAEVRAALERISDHTYGYCLNCEQRISPARLSAVPWTSFCIRCQEDVDAHREPRRDSLNELHDFLDQAA